MTVSTVALASDHAGYELKAQIARQLEAAGYTVLDLGTDGPASVDYPDFAAALAAAVTDGRAQRGVLICGSGIGISIAANRHPGIRAALVHDVTTARLSREHNDANVIALGARIIGPEIAKDCVDAFLKAEFEGGERHSRRIAKMG
ncbi:MULTISPECIES: ribose 5-phosphate isomerase B [Azospirillum]|jgi:ribose 5-phosphate isomerase B|uniref:Ribose 5-phosphate isomerase B n=1 Tax=Azospirillum ramasamyi TaxID=682998 RepID=A0A2U9S238_9PROT|nr:MULTISPECIES: ribose 5-phosphate isomerase B [Azospirillum]AWU93352.1 ribose 5-phosphate isomerase B [Azospirillum ramasamyi]MDR6771153.1 ribose 5-phosphate isomerase B [Azospirillum sp. BE72]HYF84918.1 ribose 5-phosphate isomerase B [Azospirillum sp.]